MTINRGRRAISKSLPSPIGGWNARDPVDKMGELDAIQLDNYTPRAAFVELRRGATVFARGFPAGPVETGMEYNSSTTRAMIVASGGKISSLSDDGATLTTLGSGFTVNRWQHVLWKGYLLMVNGADTPQKFDGSILAANVFTGSGLTPANLVGIALHGERLFLWEAAKPWFWYGGTGSIAGALTKFDMSQVAQKGGNVALVVNWTRDGGTGVDDLVVIVMTTGEAIVYSGTDPGDASNWSKQGAFSMPRPLGLRAPVKVGGDVVISTLEGAVSLNTVLPLDRSRQAATVSDKIRKAWLDAARLYNANDGWEALLYSLGGLLMFQIPTAWPAAPSAVTTEQYVMNTDTGSWARYRGQNLRTMFTYRDALYGGGNEEGIAWDSGVWNVSPWYSGLVHKLDDGNADLAIDIEGNPQTTNIQGDVKPAFTDLDEPGVNKRWTMARPIFQSDGDLEANIVLNVDYAEKQPSQAVASSSTGAGAIWDVATWNTSDWSSGYRVHKGWQSVKADVGRVGSLSIRTLSQSQDIRLMSIDYMAAAGGIL